MAASTKTWVDDALPQCEAEDLNGFKAENNNLISGAGQGLSTADNQQTNKAVAHYAGGGDFYVDSGAVNAYDLAAGGSRIAPPAYFAGMRIRFIPGTDNAGASTVDVAGLGAKAIKLPFYPDTALLAGDISGLVEAYYDGTDFVLLSAPQGQQVEWGLPELVGSTLSVAIGAPAITALNSTDIALIDATNDELRTYRLTAGTWAQVGSGLAVAGNAQPALAALNGTDVAFIDSSNDELRTYTFNGSVWALVGSGLAVAGVGFPALTALNGTDVAFIDSSNNELRTYTFNGSVWALVGSGLAVTSTSPTLTALNGTDVALADPSVVGLQTYRFNGSTWAAVGSALAIAGSGNPAAAALNGTDIALIDDVNDLLSVYRFDGSAWVLNSTPLAFSGASAPAMTSLNGSDVAFIHSGDDLLSSYRFPFSVGPLPRNRQITG